MEAIEAQDRAGETIIGGLARHGFGHRPAGSGWHNGKREVYEISTGEVVGTLTSQEAADLVGSLDDNASGPPTESVDPRRLVEIHTRAILQPTPAAVALAGEAAERAAVAPAAPEKVSRHRWRTNASNANGKPVGTFCTRSACGERKPAKGKAPPCRGERQAAGGAPC